MKNIIVSGATGFIGKSVVKELVSNGYNVTALVREPEKEEVHHIDGASYVKFSLENASEDLLKLQGTKYDTFFHFAWAGSAGEARVDYELQMKNVGWTVECLLAAKQLGCERFINSGSIMEKEAYDATFSRGNRPGLSYIYGTAKLACHSICKAQAAKVGIDFINPMITNAYGIGEVSPRMVNTTLRKCINGESPTFTAGTQNYDFVYIDDVARAFRLVGEKGNPFCEYIIGSGQAKQLKEFLLEMKASVAPELEFIFGDIPYTGICQDLSFFDTSDTEKDTGFKAEIGFAEGCKKTYNWLKENM